MDGSCSLVYWQALDRIRADLLQNKTNTGDAWKVNEQTRIFDASCCPHLWCRSVPPKPPVQVVYTVLGTCPTMHYRSSAFECECTIDKHIEQWHQILYHLQHTITHSLPPSLTHTHTPTPLSLSHSPTHLLTIVNSYHIAELSGAIFLAQLRLSERQRW